MGDMEKRIAKVESEIKGMVRKQTLASAVQIHAKKHFAGYELDVKQLHDLVGRLILKIVVLTEASFLARQRWPAIADEINRLVIFAFDLPDEWWDAQDRRKSRLYDPAEWKGVPADQRPTPYMTTPEWIEAIRDEYERTHGYQDIPAFRTSFVAV